MPLKWHSGLEGLKIHQSWRHTTRQVTLGAAFINIRTFSSLSLMFFFFVSRPVPSARREFSCRMRVRCVPGTEQGIGLGRKVKPDHRTRSGIRRTVAQWHQRRLRCIAGRAAARRDCSCWRRERRLRSGWRAADTWAKGGAACSFLGQSNWCPPATGQHRRTREPASLGELVNTF